MFGSIGMPELIVILVIALLVVGPRRLPDVGRSIGEAIRGFRKAMNEAEKPTLEDSGNANQSRLDEKSDHSRR